MVFKLQTGSPHHSVVPTWKPRLPSEVWTSTSSPPYGDSEPERTLSIYSEEDPELGGFRWGIVRGGGPRHPAGGVSGGNSCFLEAQAVQGWDLEGWTAGSRLRIFQLIIVPYRSGDNNEKIA
jgi:hypothetical protein